MRNAFPALNIEMSLTTCEIKLDYRIYLAMGKWGGEEGFASRGGEQEVKPCVSLTTCSIFHMEHSALVYFSLLESLQDFKF